MGSLQSTDKVLAKAKCADCEMYSPDCATCVHRYYQFLISNQYTPTWQIESLQSELRAAQAMGLSRKVECENLREELAKYKSVVGDIERALEIQGWNAQGR